jgi:hypothetical protein
MDTVSDQVEETVEQPPEQPIEQPIEPPVEQPTEKPPPKVRKVRVSAPTDPTPTPDPNYWHSRLEEHLASRRETKNERYANLRFM